MLPAGWASYFFPPFRAYKITRARTLENIAFLSQNTVGKPSVYYYFCRTVQISEIFILNSHPNSFYRKIYVRRK